VSGRAALFENPDRAAIRAFKETTYFHQVLMRSLLGIITRDHVRKMLAWQRDLPEACGHYKIETDT
jgi:hypothetical protein